MQKKKPQLLSKKEKQLEELKPKKKKLQGNKGTQLSPRAVFIAHLYANPNSPTFNNLRKSCYHSYPSEAPRSDRYSIYLADELQADKRFQREINKVYKEFMPNEKVEYNPEFLLKLLEAELTSTDPQAVFAGKRLLLEHMGKLTDMFYKYGHNKEDVEEIQDSDTQALLKRVNQLTKLLTNNNNNETTD